MDANEDSEEGIDDLDRVVGLAVIQILGIEGLAAELLGGRENGCVIEAELVSLRQVECPQYEAGGRGEHRIVRGQFLEHRSDFIKGDAEAFFP